ncbi:hypothetical protein EDD36DRAFT_201241 [Exophiala viscosa]|uniref:Uncharacterized protein n=1 Tax=Exophiala viscosa TaxID=2486360 RepID=A0AAN6DXW9_9EURO|nr:hypothetical protein EDD36DRAFT_201241 [Exophiala viscosa]
MVVKIRDNIRATFSSLAILPASNRFKERSVLCIAGSQDRGLSRQYVLVWGPKCTQSSLVAVASAVTNRRGHPARCSRLHPWLKSAYVHHRVQLRTCRKGEALHHNERANSGPVASIESSDHRPAPLLENSRLLKPIYANPSLIKFHVCQSRYCPKDKPKGVSGAVLLVLVLVLVCEQTSVS